PTRRSPDRGRSRADQGHAPHVAHPDRLHQGREGVTALLFTSTARSPTRDLASDRPCAARSRRCSKPRIERHFGARVPRRPTLRAPAHGPVGDKDGLLAHLLAVEKIASANAVMIVATSGAP